MKKRQLILSIVPILLFILLVICIKAELVTEFEDWVYLETIGYMSPILTTVIKMITHTGDAISVIFICFLLLIIPKTRIQYGLMVAINIVIVEIVNYILKIIFSRERPNILRLVNETSYSFPSGHAMINTALYTMLIFCIFHHVESRKIRCIAIIFGIFYPIVISFTRVYLGVHYITDVLGGWLLGISLTFIVYKSFKKFVWKENYIEE